MPDNHLAETTRDEEVEVEQQGDIEISEPFNPNDIKITTAPFTIGQLIDRLEHKEIKLDTEFQRLPNLWKEKGKSRFIESILLKLPIPVFYFDGQNDNNWEVVDGLQRISTLKDFILDGMKLQDLEFLKEFNGLTYKQLPREFQRRIMTFHITIYIIEDGTPANVKYNLFRRINQGGLELTPQEIRHAIHQVKPAQLVKELVDKNTSAGKAFIKVTCGSIKSDRMQDRDFVTRFISFYLISYKDYKPDLDTFMNKGMALIEKLTDSELSTLKKDFEKAMNLSYDVFGNDAFRKRYNIDHYRFGINKALFEIISVTFAKLSDQECAIIKNNKDVLKTKFMQLHHQTKFENSITQSTASKDSVENRFMLFEKIVSETLQ